jgi:hypothetical protein
MTEISRAYVELAHAIEQHQPHYIDGYFGPAEWRVLEKRPLATLADEAVALMEAVTTLEDTSRRLFLEAQIRAMQTSIALLRGETMSYAEEVRRLYDIEPARVSEQQFEEAIAALDTLLPGSGPIAAREQAFRAQFQVAPERVLPLVDGIIAELRRRTEQRFGLPEGENFEVRLVKNEPWGAYNWYLGDYRSRIDLNTDLPTYLTGLPDLIAHEAYPGHHTEHALKEQSLWREQGRAEHTLLLINTPECVISEGIAVRARQRVMNDEELWEWLAGDLAEQAGLRGADFEGMAAMNEAKKVLRYVTGNAAFLLHEAGASEEEVLAYLARYRLATPEEARKSLAFISHPTFRSYSFTYTVGGDLLDHLFEQGEADTWFRRLLQEPVTPGILRGWSGAEGPKL